MKIPDITIKITVDTPRLEALMADLEQIFYIPTDETAAGMDAAAMKKWGKVAWDHAKDPSPFRYTFARKTITPAALEAMIDIGGCTLTREGEEEETHFTLDKRIYHQFSEDGLLFSTDGRAFDTSYHGVTVSSVRWLLRRYKSAQYGGGQVDKLINRRDEGWVLFPPNTDEEADGTTMVYTLPGQERKVLVIDSHGYLYIADRKRPFKRGDPVIVNFQGVLLRGTYNTNQPEQGDCAEMAYVDFDGREQEYMLIHMDRVSHAE